MIRLAAKSKYSINTSLLQISEDDELITDCAHKSEAKQTHKSKQQNRASLNAATLSNRMLQPRRSSLVSLVRAPSNQIKQKQSKVSDGNGKLVPIHYFNGIAKGYDESTNQSMVETILVNNHSNTSMQLKSILKNKKFKLKSGSKGSQRPNRRSNFSEFPSPKAMNIYNIKHLVNKKSVELCKSNLIRNRSPFNNCITKLPLILSIEKKVLMMEELHEKLSVGKNEDIRLLPRLVTTGLLCIKMHTANPFFMGQDSLLI